MFLWIGGVSRSLASVSEDSGSGGSGGTLKSASRAKYPRIQRVADNSIAEKAGLRPFDLVIEVFNSDVSLFIFGGLPANSWLAIVCHTIFAPE